MCNGFLKSITYCHSRESGNPIQWIPIFMGMTKILSFPSNRESDTGSPPLDFAWDMRSRGWQKLCHSRESGNPIQWIPIFMGM